jgi:hypothetical protein
MNIKNIVAIGVTKRKTGPYKIKFAKNLQARLRTCRPIIDFDLINFIELPEISTKLQALEFAINHVAFQDETIKNLIKQKLDRYQNKDKKIKYNSLLSKSTTVDDVLSAI